MATLTGGERRFIALAVSIHWAQHVFYRLLPPLIPVLVVAFDLPLWQLGLLVSLYAFAGGIGQAPVGILSDRYDRRYLLPPGYVCMGVGYLVFGAAGRLGTFVPDLTLAGYGFAGSYLVMAAGMFLGGIGFSVVHPVGYPLLTDNVAPGKKGTVLGFWGSAAKFGDATGPLLVGLLLLVLSWQSILLLMGGLGLVYAGYLFHALGSPRIETIPDARRHTDAGGEADRAGQDPRSFLLPMTLIVLFFFAISLAVQGLNTFTPVFVSDVYGFSFTVLGVHVGPESAANLYFSVLLISGGLAQLVVGPLTDRFDHRAVLLVMLAAATASLVGVTALRHTWVSLLGLVTVLGVTLFGLNPARDALMSDITPPAYEGRAFGYVWTLAMLVSSAYPVLIGYLADLVGIAGGFAVLAAGPGLGAVFIALLYSDRLYRPPAGTTAAVAPSGDRQDDSR